MLRTHHPLSIELIITSCIIAVAHVGTHGVAPGHGVIGRTVGSETGHDSSLMTNMEWMMFIGLRFFPSGAGIDLVTSQWMCNGTDRYASDCVCLPIRRH